jgi:Flp pilus assembly protein TadD
MASSRTRQRSSFPASGGKSVWRLPLIVAAIFAAVVGLLIASAVLFQPDIVRSALRNPDLVSPPRFVGSEVCATCHQAEAKSWRHSHHAKAMAHATDDSVLGDFNDATFDYFSVRSRMFRRGKSFMVETDGPDGALTTFEVKYTFGVEPLQQYLVEFPDGRLQALSLSWDSRPREKGGQKWFHLYPNEKVDHTDVLHWTKLNQNWNFMCAECHSTGVRKNYNAAEDAFRTTFAEIAVGCEACHAQGSRHAAWAHAQKSFFSFTKENDAAFGLLVRYAERLNATWPIDSATGSARRSIQPATLRTETEACGMCHSRRGQLTEDWTPGRWLSHTHAISPLTRGLYDAAGQMDDEVFNYGSFRQSKMYAAGVTCSDCHDPHSGKLRISGDGACLQCHAADKFAAPAHHRHEGVSPQVTCANCHMPVRTYMVVDERHDHGFRIPRPDESISTGVRNACNDCHKDKTADWAAKAVETWYGPHRKGFQTYASAFAAARANLPDAARRLITIANDRNAPAIARATALVELSPHASPESVAAARNAIVHSDPMVRIGALEALETIPPQQIWPIAAPLLSDPVRGVRVRAAMLLAAVPPAMRPASGRRAFDAAAEEFIAAQKLHADRPDARTELGTFYARQSLVAEAEAQYKAALRLSPQFTPAVVNLADLYRQTNRDGQAVSILREGVRNTPANATLLHALGLALIREKAQPGEALHTLQRAAELAPENARYRYVHAIALHSSGRAAEALEALRSIASQHRGDRDTLAALIVYEQEAGNVAAALDYAERLSVMMQNDEGLRRLIERLRSSIKSDK